MNIISPNYIGCVDLFSLPITLKMMIHDPLNLAGNKSVSSDITSENEQMQSNPISAVISSENSARFPALLFGATTIALLIATISIANYLVTSRSSYEVKAGIENRRLVYGMIGSINTQMNTFSLLYEHSSDPTISGSGKIRWIVMLPERSDTESEGEVVNLPFCFIVGDLSDLSSAQAVSCSRVIQTGKKVAVSYSSSHPDKSLLVANLIIIEAN